MIAPDATFRQYSTTTFFDSMWSMCTDTSSFNPAKLMKVPSASRRVLDFGMSQKVLLTTSIGTPIYDLTSVFSLHSHPHVFNWGNKTILATKTRPVCFEQSQIPYCDSNSTYIDVGEAPVSLLFWTGLWFIACYIGVATISAVVVSWRCHHSSVQWLHVGRHSSKVERLVCVLTLMCHHASGAYFDISGTVGGMTPNVRNVCITSSGSVSLPSVDTPSFVAMSLGRVTLNDLSDAAYALDPGTCLTGTLSIASAPFLVPYCEASGEFPILICNPGSSTIVRCSIGEILWSLLDAEDWTGVTPSTGDWYVGLPRLYPVALDNRGYLGPNNVIWGAIDPTTAANSTLPACDCDTNQCDVNAITGFKCQDANSCPVSTPVSASIQGLGWLASGNYYGVVFSFIVVLMMNQM